MTKPAQPELPSSKFIRLTYGRLVPTSKILARLAKEQDGRIIIGKQNHSQASHTKKGHSLDHWLRSYGKNCNTRQADDPVIEQLVKLRPALFKRTKINCPMTARFCNAIELTEAGRQRAEKEKRTR